MKRLLYPLAIVFLMAFAACSSSSTSSNTDTDTDTDSDTDSDSTAETVTLSGQVAVSSSDVASIGANPPGLSMFLGMGPRFSTVGDTVLADATVTLVQKMADGTEEEVGTTTTNTEGDYTFAEVEVCQTSTGTTDDFYYEVQVTTDDVIVRAPACPDGSSDAPEVNVSPESNLAALIISDVVDVPGSETNPVPDADLFADVNTLVEAAVGDLVDSIEIPSVMEADAEDTLATANGLVTTGTEGEFVFKEYQFSSELVALEAGADTDEADYSAYLQRITRDGCDQPTTPPLTNAAAEALGEAFLAETTYTPADVVEAYNAVSNTPVEVAAAVTEYQELLGDVEEGTVSEDQALVMLSSRDLTSDTLTSTTELDPDQAVALLMILPNENYTLPVDVTEVVAELTGDTSLDAAAIADYQIYHNRMSPCSEAGDGHFMAEVTVYVPGSQTVTGVIITSSDTSALGGDGSATLTSQGNLWMSNETGVCVNTSVDVTYTITATLSDLSTVVLNDISRNHPLVPESNATFDGAPLGEENAPTITTVARPTLAWDDPDDQLAEIIDAPAGSAVKYTYEYAHKDVGNGGPAGHLSCPSVTSGALYAVNNFIPTVDCDVDACATALGVASSSVNCRINIQTYLVDENDKILGQAAGGFKFLCVDTNGDGDCGA